MTKLQVPRLLTYLQLRGFFQRCYILCSAFADCTDDIRAVIMSIIAPSITSTIIRLLIFNSLIVAFPHAITNQTSLLLPFSNSTSLSAFHPPSTFTYQTILSTGTHLLPDKACFALTLRALADLAALPFDARMSTAKILHLPSYPGISLGLVGPPGVAQRGFEIKYAVWGLVLAIWHMVGRNDFRDWGFALRSQGSVVGEVEFRVEEPPSIQPKQQQEQGTNILDGGGGGFKGDIGDDGPELELTFRPLSTRTQVLTCHEVMMVLYGGLADAAVPASQQPVPTRSFYMWFRPYRISSVLTSLLPRGPEGDVLWNYALVVRVLRRVGEWYLEQSSCTGVTFGVMESGKGPIASGSLLADQSELAQS